jgi:putative toxin-antitoxin system antitoxin component (TIGR02293 family)
MTQQSFKSTLQRSFSAPLLPRPSDVRSGLPAELADEICAWLGLPAAALERMLGSSARTLQRRRKRGETLSPHESDRLWRLLFVRDRARQALGSDERARTWLTSPHALLGGESPVERLDTEPGLREVEDMLTVTDETAAA